MAWSYYAYTVELCFHAIEDPLMRWVFLLCYHVLFILFVWAYAATIFTNPGIPNKRYRMSHDFLIQLTDCKSEAEEKILLRKYAQNLPLACRQENGDVRTCKQCSIVKPDRCHHCSICRQCVLKMDHHCPWVNNCVGHGNYKFFVLFLFYASSYCLYVGFTDLKFFIKYWTLGGNDDVSMAHRLQIIFLGLVAFMFVLGVAGLLGYHIYLLLHNKTTIESFRAPVFVSGRDHRAFSIGWRNNFIQVFGANKFLWFIPVFTSLCDGHAFPCTQREPENGSLLGFVSGSLDSNCEEEEINEHTNSVQCHNGLGQVSLLTHTEESQIV
jgi:hypothetical protein